MFGRSVSCLITYSIHVSCMCAIRKGWHDCHVIIVVLYFHYSLVLYYRICMFRPLVLCHCLMAMLVILVLCTIARMDRNIIL